MSGFLISMRLHKAVTGSTGRVGKDCFQRSVGYFIPSVSRQKPKYSWKGLRKMEPEEGGAWGWEAPGTRQRFRASLLTSGLSVCFPIASPSKNANVFSSLGHRFATLPSSFHWVGLPAVLGCFSLKASSCFTLCPLLMCTFPVLGCSPLPRCYSQHRL